MTAFTSTTLPGTPEIVECHCGSKNRLSPKEDPDKARCGKCCALLVQPSDPDWKEVAAEVIRLMQDRDSLCRYCNQSGKRHSMEVGGGRDHAHARVGCPEPYVPVAGSRTWGWVPGLWDDPVGAPKDAG